MADKKTTTIHKTSTLTEYNALMTEWYGDSAATKQHAEYDSAEKDALMQRMQWMKDNGIDLGDSQEKFDQVYAAITGVGDAGDFRLNGGWEIIGANERMGDTEMQAMGNVMMQLDMLRENGTISLEDYQDYMTDLFSKDTMDDLVAGAYGGQFQTLVQDICNVDAREAQGQYENESGVESRTVIRDTDDYLKSYAERNGLDEVPSYSGEEAESMLYDMLLDHKDELDPGTVDRMNDFLADYGAYSVSKSTLMITAINDALETGDKDLLNKYMDPSTYENMWDGPLTSDLADLDKTVRGVDTSAKAFETSHGDTEQTASAETEVPTAGTGLDYDHVTLSNDDLKMIMDGGPDGRYEKMKDTAVDIWMGKYGNGAARKEALAEAGFSDDEIKDLGRMVDATQGNMYGMTKELYDSLFSERDGSLADQRESYGKLVSDVMTFEGPGDLFAKLGEYRDVFKGDAGLEAATQIYMNSAEYLNGHQDEIGKGFKEDVHGEAAKEEVTMNLQSYMAEGVATFTGAEKNADKDVEATKQAEKDAGFEFGE